MSINTETFKKHTKPKAAGPLTERPCGHNGKGLAVRKWCKHGWDLHAMGNVRQGSGGSEWVAVYNDEYLVRFTAMQASITYSDSGEPSIRALVHPLYCDEVQEECRIDMKLP